MNCLSLWFIILRPFYQVEWKCSFFWGCFHWVFKAFTSLSVLSLTDIIGSLENILGPMYFILPVTAKSLTQKAGMMKYKPGLCCMRLCQ